MFEKLTGRASDKGGFLWYWRKVSQGDILDTSLNLILTVFHLTVPTLDEHACSSVHRERENAYTSVSAKRGSACSTIWPRFPSPPPPLPPSLSLSRFLSLCRAAGSLLNSHIHNELWCCPKHTQTHTSGARCMDHTAQRVLSLVPRSESVRDFYSVSVFFCLFFYIEVISICYSVQNIRGC